MDFLDENQPLSNFNDDANDLSIHSDEGSRLASSVNNIDSVSNMKVPAGKVGDEVESNGEDQ